MVERQVKLASTNSTTARNRATGSTAVRARRNTVELTIAAVTTNHFAGTAPIRSVRPTQRTFVGESTKAVLRNRRGGRRSTTASDTATIASVATSGRGRPFASQ